MSLILLSIYEKYFVLLFNKEKLVKEHRCNFLFMWEK